MSHALIYMGDVYPQLLFSRSISLYTALLDYSSTPLRKFLGMTTPCSVTLFIRFAQFSYLLHNIEVWTMLN